ncbi:hypothetical protein BCR37DRAFT_53522 [Protomyces lactucae-debilis]|uniref:GET complex, subunit GET2 n=1 Tax=Protomyces lactucae-debilis TaxID=2754530 RepID=A0A1Y2FBH8_PROLT|nr:uncharacterized protein BCR37DRAFT_53522 [Protomyces lactucae-debilis]ORY80794.1 hypothetical protein BCR37DRAFT_53522 [Protomyces lactucae-debilis]
MAIEDVSLAGSEPELVMDDESDPEEVDISTVDTDIHLRQRAPLYGPPRPPHMQQAPADFGSMPMGDPFAILQQMGMGQGGAGGDPFGFGGGQGFPQSPAGMSSHQQQQQKQQTEAAQKTARTNKLWQVLHLSAIAVLIIFLRRESIPSYGLRAPSKIGGQAEPIFWYFATIELVLQTLRFFIGGAQVQGSMIATIGAMLPPPYNVYAMVLARYSLILTTLRDDACALLLGLAVRAWLGI